MLIFPDFSNLLIISALLGLIPAFIAQSKGRPFLLWYIYLMCRKAPSFSYGDIRHVHRICVRNILKIKN